MKPYLIGVAGAIAFMSAGLMISLGIREYEMRQTCTRSDIRHVAGLADEYPEVMQTFRQVTLNGDLDNRGYWTIINAYNRAIINECKKKK